MSRTRGRTQRGMGNRHVPRPRRTTPENPGVTGRPRSVLLPDTLTSHSTRNHRTHVGGLSDSLHRRVSGEVWRSKGRPKVRRSYPFFTIIDRGLNPMFTSSLLPVTKGSSSRSKSSKYTKTNPLTCFTSPCGSLWKWGVIGAPTVTSSS